jgi:uncharacterized membrane protein
MRRAPLNHPSHPIFVHLPIGLWLASLACDILFMINGSSLMAAISYYCMLFGLIGVVLAAPTGLWDYRKIPSGSRAKKTATIHMSLNLAVTLLYVINFFARHGLENAVPSFVTRGQLVLSAIGFGTLGVSGFLGGVLVYTYGIGTRHPTRGDIGKPKLRRVA